MTDKSTPPLRLRDDLQTIWTTAPKGDRVLVAQSLDLGGRLGVVTRIAASVGLVDGRFVWSKGVDRVPTDVVDQAEGLLLAMAEVRS